MPQERPVSVKRPTDSSVLVCLWLFIFYAYGLKYLVCPSQISVILGESTIFIEWL